MYTELIIALPLIKELMNHSYKHQNLMTATKVGSKTQNNQLKLIWQVESILSSALVDVVDSAEQESEQKMFIEVDDFDDYTEMQEWQYGTVRKYGTPQFLLRSTVRLYSTSFL